MLHHMKKCPHARVKAYEWQGLKTTLCQDCGEMLSSPSAEEGLAVLRNQENGLPPGIIELLNTAQNDSDRALIMEGLMAVLRQKAREDFMERYGEPDDDDLEPKTQTQLEQETDALIRETEEILRKREQPREN